MSESVRFRGRPKKKDATTFTFYFDNALHERLIAFCNDKKMNQTQAIELALSVMLDKYEGKERSI